MKVLFFGIFFNQKDTMFCFEGVDKIVFSFYILFWILLGNKTLNTVKFKQSH